VNSYNRAPGLSNEQAVILLRYAKNNGADSMQCLSATGLNLDDIMTHGSELAAEQELAFIDALIKQVPKTAALAGYEVGLECKLHNFGIIGQAMLSSRTLGDALNIGIRYCEKAFHFSRCTTDVLDTVLTVTLQIAINVPSPLEQFLLARDLGTIVSIFQFVFGEENKKVFEVGIHSDTPALITHIEQALECKVSPNNQRTFLQVDVSTLATPMPFASHNTAELLEKLCYQQIHPAPAEGITRATATRDTRDTSEAPNSTFNRCSILDQIRMLLEQADNYNLSREDAASKLHMSSRTLARHLQQLDINWRELIAELRIEKAKHLLEDKNLSISDISERVGFSSNSAFSIAFSRATGRTPSKYKDQISKSFNDRSVEMKA
jgi:AraC-like DNA-binding protein